MNRTTRLLLVLALLAPAALAQDGPSTPPRGAAREQMWPAPTAEDWAKPCLITFQRTWDDALAVARETGKAILVCVNMDGEIASEHYAGVRYRQPDIAALYEPYVCVIASVYRHTPRDYDDEGRRILCPRFGSVTCDEHIRIEPGLYEKYFDGQRIAPRHVMVELDGSEKYDVFYANDTASVFQRIREGIEKRENQPPPVVRGDRPILERVASREVTDRAAVEAAYRQADPAMRRKLLEAALEKSQAAQIDLMRRAVFGLDAELSRIARQALARTDSPAAANLIVEALKVPMDEAERESLVAALERLGENSPKAFWLAVVHRGLSARSDVVDAKAWTTAGGTYAPPERSREWNELEDQRALRAGAAREHPDDPVTRLELAESYLALGMEARKSSESDPKTTRMLARLLFSDARSAGLEAEKLGATPWRTNTVLALAAYYDGNVDEAYARAAPAVKELPPGESGWNSMAVLTVFAESRWKAIKAASRERKRWPAQWLADLNATYTVLLRHPLGTAEQIAWHHDFLVWLRAFDQASRFLDEALARFPDSTLLHQRLRTRVLEQKGVAGLEPAYDAILGATEAPSAAIVWHAGVAASVTADYHRRASRRDDALAAFGRAIAHYERALAGDPSRRDAADRAIALALGSRARLAYESDDDERALADILASFERSPGTAGSRDGGGFTPGETAQMLLARLRERKRDDLAARLDAALAKIDPELLRPDRE